MTEKSCSLYGGFCADMKAKIDGLNDTEYQKAIKVKELQNLLNSIGYERSGHGDNNRPCAKTH